MPSAANRQGNVSEFHIVCLESGHPVNIQCRMRFVDWWIRLSYTVRSPHAACNINKTESCQRRFTKRIKGLYGLDYLQRLEYLGLETLQIRRVKCAIKLLMAKFLCIAALCICCLLDFSQTRGHEI